MKRIQCISRAPRPAEDIAPDVKITFVVDVLEAAIPLFQNKNPSNPA